MSYIDKTLLPNEQVIYRGKVHWMIYVAPMLWTIISIVLCIALLPKSSDSSSSGGSGFVTFILIVFFVWSAINWIKAVLFTWGTEYGITNRRVVLKTGLIVRKTAELAVGRVESLRVDQTIIGRILGYGTIVVTGTGGAADQFPFCASVMEFRRHVFVATDQPPKP
jgi:uncharacterized membrane protein YdbT with pleckstrin-like domain